MSIHRASLSSEPYIGLGFIRLPCAGQRISAEDSHSHVLENAMESVSSGAASAKLRILFCFRESAA